MTNPFRRALQGWTENQWCQGGLSDEQNRLCIIGRICSVTTFKEQGPTCHFLNKIASQMFPDRTRIGYAFPVNDHPDTTFQDIQSILEKCAVRWDEIV
jgi:hypothetical protein